MYAIRPSRRRYPMRKGIIKFLTCFGRSLDNFFIVFTVIIILEILIALYGLMMDQGHIKSSYQWLGIGAIRFLILCVFQYKKVKSTDREALLKPAMYVALVSGVLAVGNFVVMCFAEEHAKAARFLAPLTSVDIVLCMVYICGFSHMKQGEGEDDDVEEDPAERRRDDYLAELGRKEYLKGQQKAMANNVEE